MKPVQFKEVTRMLPPSKKVYSDNVVGLTQLPIWSDGEQCVSCWKMSLRERLSALFFGRVWLSLLSGQSQPPAYIGCKKEYFEEV